MDALLAFVKLKYYAPVRQLLFLNLLRKLQGLFLKLSTVKGLKHLLLQRTGGKVDVYIFWEVPSQTDWHLRMISCTFCTAYLHVVPEQTNLGRISKSHVEYITVTLLHEHPNNEQT